MSTMNPEETRPAPTRPPSWLNPTAASLLGFLHEGDYSGYELVGVAERTIGNFWSLTRSQVYRELATLAERGLVEPGETGPRARRPYRLTQVGRDAFAAWVAQPPGSEQIRHPLLLTLSFGAALPPERLREFLDEHRRQHAKRLAGYEAVPAEADLDRWRLATLAFGIHYERAVLAWMDELPGIVGDAAPTPDL
jgi:DNA-binding PadR family transcriptional regulator